MKDDLDPAHGGTLALGRITHVTNGWGHDHPYNLRMGARCRGVDQVVVGSESTIGSGQSRGYVFSYPQLRHFTICFTFTTTVIGGFSEN